MLHFRIAAAAATLLVFSAVAGASAQTAANQPAGRPLQLLKIAEQPSKAQAKPPAKAIAKSTVRRTKVAARRKKQTHVAALRRHRPQLPAQAAATPVTTPSPPPDSIWPAARPAMATDIPTPAPQPATAPVAPDPREVVVAGQSVQVTPPDEVNEIDLAANDATSEANDAALTGSTAGTPPLHEIEDANPKSDSIKALVANQPQQPNEVGSTSWFLQVLAALGGAITAGTVAWFLIGGTPQRTYG